jgi:predicted dehydrogenase
MRIDIITASKFSVDVDSFIDELLFEDDIDIVIYASKDNCDW